MNQRTESFGRKCLLARRLVERGVRFVELFHLGRGWDTHGDSMTTKFAVCAPG